MTDKQIPLRLGIRVGVSNLPPRSLERREYDDAPQFAANVVVCGESASMLRVITERQGDRCRLDLHGTIGGEWVAVLERHWRSLANDVPSAKVTVVLSNVDFIAPDGKQLLQRMADEGVEFVVAGSMNRYVIESLRPCVSAAKEGGRR